MPSTRRCTGWSGGAALEHLGRGLVEVVADVRHDGLDEAGDATIYVPHAQFATSDLDVVLRTGRDPTSLAEPLHRAVLDVDPALPVYGVTSLTGLVRQAASLRRTFASLLAAFAAAAVLLTAVGVYAVTAGAVGRRTREIGVRRAVGAGTGDVQRLVLREEIPGIVLGLLAGIGGSLGLAGSLRGVLYGVAPVDPVTLAAAAGLLLTVALAAVWVPARRAAGIEPLDALRVD